MADKDKALALAERLMGGGGDATKVLVSGVRRGEHPNAEREPGDGKAENLSDDNYQDDDQDDNLDDDTEIDDTEPEVEETEGEDEEVLDDTDEEVEDDQEAESDEELEQETAEFTYNDEDTLEVMVDGELREVSLKDLKEAYSGEGAISKRLKDATEIRKAAQAERNLVHQEVTEYRQNLAKVITQLDGLLFAPMIDPPDPKLRTRDMQQYLLHKDAYDDDQKRIAEGRQQVQAFLQQEFNANNDNAQRLRQSEQQLLIQKSGIKDKQGAERFQSDVSAAVEAYGITQEEVNSAMSHKLFLMARDAGKWIKYMAAKKNGTVPTGGEKKTTTGKRLLKAGSASASVRKAKLKQGQKERQAITQKAKRTGDPNDIAAMILANAVNKQTGGRRGR